MARATLSFVAVAVVFTAVLGVAAALPGDLLSEKSPTICDPDVKQWAGYIEIDAATDKNYFFWFFEARNNPETAPVVLWMTGGPGCSSELAIFDENGPCHIDPTTGKTVNNTYSWNNIANVLYIDQPAGTGFSYGDESGYDHNEKQVAEDMYTFLQGFYKAHPEYQSNDFYATGESYGGHYVPATSYRVQQGNALKEGIHINIKGVAVGNGLTDPEIQYKYYALQAYNFSIAATGKPVISLSTYEQMTAAIPNCISLIKDCQTLTGDCGYAQQVCNDAMLSPYMATGQNPYDIRKRCQVPPLCYNFQPITDYLNSAAVRAALGVGDRKWSMCNFEVNSMFSSDWMKDYQQDIPPQLGNGTRVLIYAGDDDFICNWQGNKAWTLNLNWPGHDAFNAAKDMPWSVAGKQAGIVRTADNFTFLQVFNAGHMVPQDVPLQALTMLQTFLNDGKFA